MQCGDVAIGLPNEITTGKEFNLILVQTMFVLTGAVLLVASLSRGAWPK